LSLPLYVETKNIIDKSAMAKMKRGAVLVNMARGPIVVHDDLVEALESGHLAGAVMDVTEPEPLPPDSRLWDMPNVIITPHVGGQAAWRIDKMTDLFCQNLKRRQAGLPLINYLTDKRLGFPIRGRGYPIWGD
jgi:phosphoglycerate dehydrogenase-like enzyme